jgi:hypothetical protein
MALPRKLFHIRSAISPNVHVEVSQDFSSTLKRSVKE